jgi:tRNA threonylcarbamoyladenosine biosynthesis protein TsaB
MLILAIDTAAAFCSACLYDTDSHAVMAREERDIGRGHAEQLVDVVNSAMQRGGTEFSEIDRIAVAVGPGSFTGIRVGVAAARGFGLALGVPVVGVTTLEAIGHAALGVSADRAVTVAIEGGRGQIFMQSFDAHGNSLTEPAAFEFDDAVAAVPADVDLLAGNAAERIACHLGRPVDFSPMNGPTCGVETYAVLGASSNRKPVPLYLRGADAKPQAGFALPHVAPEGAART